MKPRTKDPKDQQSPRRPKSPIGSCVLTGLLIFFVLCAAIIGLYVAQNRRIAITVPAPVVPNPNAFDELIRIGLLTKAMKHKSPPNMLVPYPQTETFSNYQTSALEFEPIRQKLRSVFGKPCLHPVVRFNGVAMPSYGPLRETARALSGEARYYEIVGRPGKAVEIRLDGFEMSPMIQRGGPLIAFLVARAIESISGTGLEDDLPLLSDVELAAAARRLDRIISQYPRFSDTIREEGNYTTSATAASLNSETTIKERYENMRQLADVDEGHRPNFSQAWKMAKYTLSNKEAMLRDNQAYFEELAKDYDRPFAGPSKVRVPDNLLANWFSMISENSPARHAGSIAAVRLLRVEVALYRYRKASGRFPDRLDALVPRLLGTIPTDPFGGDSKPSFIYKPLKNGAAYLLYSIGPDMKDDGGTASKSPGIAGAGDIVAGKIWNPTRRFKPSSLKPLTR